MSTLFAAINIILKVKGQGQLCPLLSDLLNQLRALALKIATKVDQNNIKFQAILSKYMNIALEINGQRLLPIRYRLSFDLFVARSAF